MTTQLLTLAELGIAQPKGELSHINAEGITVHYGGPSPWPSRKPEEWDHNRCASIWRAWDAFHRSPGALGSPTGGLMIAYTSGVCPHGVRLSGRGLSHRTAANGTNEGNSRSYAVVYVAGVGDPLTDEAKVAYLDEQAHLGVPLKWAHRDWYGTECPGTPLTLWLRAGCPPPSSAQPVPPTRPVLPPNLASSTTYVLEEPVATLQVIEYPVPSMPEGEGYWDLDGSPGRPLVKAGRCSSIEINGADKPGDQPGGARPLKYNGYTRVRLFGFEKNAAPLLLVTAIVD